MKNTLKRELDTFMVKRGERRGGVYPNPPMEKLYEFLEVISKEGKLLDYSEQDWVEAGRSYGLTDDDISNWIETAASWIDDTTDEGKFDPEPAFWGQKL